MNFQIIVFLTSLALLITDAVICIKIMRENLQQARDYKRCKMLSKLFFVMKQNPARGVL